MNLKEHLQHHRKELDTQEMSFNSEAIFKDRLKEELHQAKKGKVVYLRFISVAASIVLVFSIFFWNQNIEVSAENKEVLACLTDESAGTRLSGVYKFEDEFEKEDSKIINTLIKILHEDANVNVKIATIDALLKYPTNEKIRTSLVSALEKEKTPLVQIKIIKSLGFLKENRAQKPLENIINNKQTYPIVKNNATLAMNQLKQ